MGERAEAAGGADGGEGETKKMARGRGVDGEGILELAALEPRVEEDLLDGGAVVGIDAEELAEEVVEFGRVVSAGEVEVGGTGIGLDLLVGGTTEGPGARNEDVEEDTETPDVSLLGDVGLAAAIDLGGSVVDSADAEVSDGVVGGTPVVGELKVGDDGAVVGGDEDVLGLQVEVGDLAVVTVSEAMTDVTKVLEGGLLVEGTTAFDELHEVGLGLLEDEAERVAGAVNAAALELHDMGHIDEAGETVELVAGVFFKVADLDDHILATRSVLGCPDLCVPAAGHLFGHVVVSEGLPGDVLAVTLGEEL
mmetsp:Transcript_20974/g.34950  ORF Transcript_20974/g.34950 Transcript_20974/m.34950 type:complete len:308 (+) Transcript_20974:328-1251(+)